jgi:glycosyltransferase involved in cell wall biosynthesis
VRIAQVATVGYPVRADSGGSIETVVWNLAEQLVAMGHEVTVLATGDSRTSARLVPVLERGYVSADPPVGDWMACEWMNLCAAVERAREFDVLHSHAYLYGLPLTRLCGRPFVHTTHVQASRDNLELVRRHPAAHVTAISAYQWQAFPGARLLATIHHGLDPSLFQAEPGSGDYLCFLGRFIPGKGPTLAVDLARRLGMPLVMAGERTEYFTAAVEPLVDGRLVRWVGPVYGAAKADLLAGAAALVYPVDSPEPFGLVMIEAMLSGTPVAALGRGAVPELVEPGITGHHAPDLDTLADLLPEILRLDRRQVRARAEKRFAARRMAEEYVAAYERIV